MIARTSRILVLVLACLALWNSPGNARAAVSKLHHDLAVQLDPKARSINVSDHLRIQGGGDVIIHLATNMIITRFRINGQPGTHDRTGETLRMDLGAPGDHQVLIEYRGRLSDFPKAPGIFDGVPMIASAQGSYLSAASAWHPTVQGIGATYRMTLALPNPQKAVVPGRLIEEKNGESQYSAVFDSEIPTQGIVLIAGPFVVNEQRHGALTLRTYFPSGLEELSPGYLESTLQYINQYSDQIGKYPFSSFHIVSGPLPVGLGFPGMTYIGERVLQLPFIRFTSLGHEVLHNWWGNGVEVDYDQGNWAEGLTTYMADYAFTGLRDKSNFKRMRTEWLRDYAALPPRRDHAVRNFVSRRHDAAQIIGYNKVAFIFHMLKRRVGERKFAQGIRNFWNTFKFQSAGWKDIRFIFEKVSGRDLGVFFKQWVDRSGAPRLVMSDLRNNNDTLSFIISQPELPYSLNVPIRLVTDEGEKMYQAGIDGGTSRIELPLPASPVSVSVDPDFDIFRRLDAEEAPPIIRDITLNAETVVIFTGADKEMERVSRELANRLLDNLPNFAAASLKTLPKAPLMIIGPTEGIQRFLHKNNLPDTPKTLKTRGTARIWAAQRSDCMNASRPLLVIEANNIQALRDLFRPLPHYGRRGYLVFEGRKAIDSGVWPAQAGPLSIIFK